MKNKKIFFVADTKSIHIVKWVDYFVDEDYDVYLATFASVNNTKCKNIYFLGNKKSNVSGGNYHYFFGITELSRILKKIQPDSINAHYSYSMGLIALMAKNKSKIKCRFSVVCHGSDVLVPPIPYIMNKVNKYILTKAEKIFVVSDQIKDKIESLNIDMDKIFVGQYGVDIVSDKIDKDIDILSNRAYMPNSRINFLLEAIDALECKELNIVFVVPNIEENEYDELLIKYPYITFYKQIEYNKMINLVCRTKIYIAATISDGTALSLLEAMELECIPLISNIVSNRSWVLDGVNGYTFNGTVDFMLKLKNILALDTNTRKDMIHLNKKLISDKGNYNIQMKKIEDFLI